VLTFFVQSCSVPIALAVICKNHCLFSTHCVITFVDRNRSVMKSREMSQYLTVLGEWPMAILYIPVGVGCVFMSVLVVDGRPIHFVTHFMKV